MPQYIVYKLQVNTPLHAGNIVNNKRWSSVNLSDGNWFHQISQLASGWISGYRMIAEISLPLILKSQRMNGLHFLTLGA